MSCGLKLFVYLILYCNLPLHNYLCTCVNSNCHISALQFMTGWLDLGGTGLNAFSVMWGQVHRFEGRNLEFFRFCFNAFVFLNSNTCLKGVMLYRHSNVSSLVCLLTIWNFYWESKGLYYLMFLVPCISVQFDKGLQQDSATDREQHR
jgi:hypothetical protein